MLHDWQTYNVLYGTTNNPWDLSRTPGGSSGGSAAALAAGFVSLELGSDFAGSIRAPAHFCGVYSHKPSVHLIPMRGAAGPGKPPSPHPRSDFIVAGPMARSADDLALALEILAGPDELWDGKAYRLSLPSPRYEQLKNYRVLIINSHPLCQTSLAVIQSLANLTENLIRLGVTVCDDNKKIPDLANITQIYMTLFSAFLTSNMPAEEYEEIREAALFSNSDCASIKGAFLRGSILTQRDWEHINIKRNQLRTQWRNQFKEFDVIICPVMPTPAFFHDHSDSDKRLIKVDENFIRYDAQFVWPSIATLFGLPSTVAPINCSKEGLPIGVQVMGDYLEDYTTIQFAKLLEREFGGFQRPQHK